MTYSPRKPQCQMWLDLGARGCPSIDIPWTPHMLFRSMVWKKFRKPKEHNVYWTDKYRVGETKWFVFQMWSSDFTIYSKALLNPYLSTKYKATSTPHSVLCWTSTNVACLSRVSLRGRFSMAYSTAPTRNASGAWWNLSTCCGVMSPDSRSLLSIAWVVKLIFSFCPTRDMD